MQNIFAIHWWHVSREEREYRRFSVIDLGVRLMIIILSFTSMLQIWDWFKYLFTWIKILSIILFVDNFFLFYFYYFCITYLPYILPHSADFNFIPFKTCVTLHTVYSDFFILIFLFCFMFIFLINFIFNQMFYCHMCVHPLYELFWDLW